MSQLSSCPLLFSAQDSFRVPVPRTATLMPPVHSCACFLLEVTDKSQSNLKRTNEATGLSLCVSLWPACRCTSTQETRRLSEMNAWPTSAYMCREGRRPPCSLRLTSSQGAFDHPPSTVHTLPVAVRVAVQHFFGVDILRKNGLVSPQCHKSQPYRSRRHL